VPQLTQRNDEAYGCLGCGCIVLVALAVSYPIPAGILAVALLIAGGASQASKEKKQREAQRNLQLARLRELGGGNLRLGADVEACQQRIAQLEREEQEVEARLATVRAARTKIGASRLRSLVDTYDRAETILISQHLEPRRALRRGWEEYLRDLEAMAAAHQAEAALDGLPDLFRYDHELTAERERLERLTGDLAALAEVEQLLRA